MQEVYFGLEGLGPGTKKTKRKKEEDSFQLKRIEQTFPVPAYLTLFLVHIMKWNENGNSHFKWCENSVSQKKTDGNLSYTSYGFGRLLLMGYTSEETVGV